MTAFFHGSVPVLENAPLATRTYRIRLAAPELARAIRPGQFLMLRLPGTTDPLLGRPLALYDTWLDAQGEPAAVVTGSSCGGRLATASPI
jgi:dihydroorotate dehydrogenase electron transfer subunit